MNYCYGQVRLGKGGIPAGGADQYKAYGVFTAAENPVEIVAGQYRSGDLNDDYTVAIVPPDFPNLSGQTTIDGGNQGVVALFTVKGGKQTATIPGPFYTGLTNSSGARYIIPPFHHVVVWCEAASTADFKVYFLGMDLVKP